HRAAVVSQHGVDAATAGLGCDSRLLQLLAPLPDPALDLLAVLLAEPPDVVDLERRDRQQLADGGDVETRDRRQGARAEAGLLDGRLGRDRGSGGVIAYGGGAVVVEILEDREPGGHQLIDVAVAVLGLRRESLAEEQRQGGRNDRLEAVRGDDRRVARARGTRPTALPPDLVAGGHLEQRGRDGPQLGGTVVLAAAAATQIGVQVADGARGGVLELLAREREVEEGQASPARAGVLADAQVGGLDVAVEDALPSQVADGFEQVGAVLLELGEGGATFDGEPGGERLGTRIGEQQ